MIGLVARLTRSVPLIIVLVILAVIIYFAVTYFRSKARAKEILIAVFTVICSVIIAFFGLVSLYALFEHNEPVLELAASFAGVGVVGLVITLICRHIFKKHNPHYRWKAEKARIERDKERKRADRKWPFDMFGGPGGFGGFGGFSGSGGTSSPGSPFGPGGPFSGGTSGPSGGTGNSDSDKRP